MEFADVGIEVDGGDADGEGHVDSLGAGGAGGGLIDDASDSRGCEEVIGCYEVVCVPLLRLLDFGVEF